MSVSEIILVRVSLNLPSYLESDIRLDNVLLVSFRFSRILSRAFVSRGQKSIVIQQSEDIVVLPLVPGSSSTRKVKFSGRTAVFSYKCLHTNSGFKTLSLKPGTSQSVKRLLYQGTEGADDSNGMVGWVFDPVFQLLRDKAFGMQVRSFFFILCLCQTDSVIPRSIGICSESSLFHPHYYGGRRTSQHPTKYADMCRLGSRQPKHDYRFI